MTQYRLGGIAALVLASTFVFGFLFAMTVTAPFFEHARDPDRLLQFLVENQRAMYLWNCVIYLLFGACLVVLVIALDRKLRVHAPIASQIASAFGYIWSGLVIASGMVANVGHTHVVELATYAPGQAATLLVSINTVVDGLGGGNEIVGGLWVLLISLFAWQPNTLPRTLNGIGFISGTAGVSTAFPGLNPLGAVFGLTLIVWFASIGIVLCQTTRSGCGCRQRRSPTHETVQRDSALPSHGMTQP